MVSGAGPAYVYFLVEEFAAAARRLGFGDATASELLLETFHGSLSLLDASGRAPSALLAEIASPGSASERAIAALEQAAVAEHAERAMRAALARAEELRGATMGSREF
jgi:pyrroline-5-carboxylate reductase